MIGYLMEFYLKYDGPLKPSGKPEDKQMIREYFRPQLERLWDTVPLKDVCEQKKFLHFPEEKGKTSVIKEIGGIRFAPLVTNAIFLICELDIIMLWKDEPGQIINTGDIDNRLKTLFDALACPNEEQVKNHKESIEKYQPYFVLLEDDKLITSVRVETNRLLLPDLEQNDLSLLIKVKTKPYRVIYNNMVL